MFSLAVIAFVSCHEKSQICDHADAGSVNVRISNEQGAPLTPDSVTWSVNGGSFQDAECVNRGCSEWVAGWEVSGAITVSAKLGNTITTSSATVLQGQCHVIPQSIHFQLEDPTDT